MDLFSNVVNEVMRGLVSAATETTSAREIAETCCKDIGWSVDERPSGNELCLHFNDPLLGIRKVFVTLGDEDTTLTFKVFSAATLPAESIPIEALGYLLARNSEMVVAWQASELSSGKVAFALRYCTLAFGFHAPLFKFICDTMANEALQFDSKMKDAGLL